MKKRGFDPCSEKMKQQPCSCTCESVGLCKNTQFEGNEKIILMYTREKDFLRISKGVCSASFCNKDAFCNNLCSF